MVCAWMPAGSPLTGVAQAAASQDGAEKRDRVTLSNGRVVEGVVLEETATHVRMRVYVGTLSTETSYPLSDVLTIERGVVAVGARDDKASAPTRRGEPQRQAVAPSDDAARVVMFELKGIFGTDVSQTPLQRALDDAVSQNPDVIIIKMDTTQDERAGFQGIFRAEDMTGMVEDYLREGHRIVFWIKEATVGAAFLPFVSPEIYFTSDGRMGGIGTLQDFSVGDSMVTEKLISAFSGHAEGVALTGGYAPEIIRAMGRMDYWLAVRFRGGRPEFYINTQKPSDEMINNEGWTILSDNGQGAYKDTLEDIVRGRGNDVLNLDADWALRLRVSQGTYDRLEDLVFGLGLGSEHVKVEGRSQRIVDDWRTRIRAGIDRAQRISREMQENQRLTTRDEIQTRLRNLRELRSILSQFAEVLDAGGQQRSQIDMQIEDLRQALANADRQRR
ncbi:MAG: hypothetical protein EA379_06075 [Phycisphaerales bacterium]|nr:MAG: hypothetical protein EA379_06075 [Phycisphaerales bacterium]